MSRVWLKETDKEVECFHPVCEEALNKALKMMKLEEQYKVEHHRYAGSLEMDLVISNRTTGKVFCVIEVKRTIPAVYSSRYQYQAMSYVQSLRDSEKETNYYILTNLECSCMFKYSAHRSNVYDQMLQPGVVFNHRFRDVPEEKFREDLALQFSEFIQKILNNDSNYILSFSEFAASVREAMPSHIKWNTSLAFMFYEYIRGSFNEIGRNELYDIRYFKNDITAICREASKVNFKGIFGFANEDYDNRYHPVANMLVDLYKLGTKYKDADAICNIMHQVISEGHTHDGEVPTDIELAQTVVSLVRTIVPIIDPDDVITDPAAGSGTLLSAAIDGYRTINPIQIRANDINPLLIQLLTLRMGLHFATTISRSNFPSVTTEDIAVLSPRYFDKTKIVVLNPPYLSATAGGCIEKKGKLASRIKAISGNESKTNIGQAALENIFLELIVNLVIPGTVIACIIPNTHLSALGPAEVAFRQFLLSDFGLKMVFNYPQTDLFEDVVQNTSVLIGIAHEAQPKIQFVQSLSLVSEINQDEIQTAIDNLKDVETAEELVPGLLGNYVPCKRLNDTVADGWKCLDPVFGEVSNFVNSHISKNQIFESITDNTTYKRYRGSVGNNGGSDLLYITQNKEFFKQVKDYVECHLRAGLRNSNYNSYYVGDGDEQFFDVTDVPDHILETIINIFLSRYNRTTQQSKKPKPIAEWIRILKKEATHYVPINTVLLPRSSRKYASVYITTKNTYLSTNLLAIETGAARDSRIIASWMNSIFYQMQLELVCKNQGGMRKLEIENINRTYVPQLSKLSTESIDKILAVEDNSFFDLKNPTIREVDKVWAQIIIGNEKVESMLDSALRYMTVMAKNRES